MRHCLIISYTELLCGTRVLYLGECMGEMLSELPQIKYPSPEQNGLPFNTLIYA